MFYWKGVIIATSFSPKFNTDKVFSLFSLLCKQIDLSVPWNDLKVPKYMHRRCLIWMLNVGPLGQTCPRDRVSQALSQSSFLRTHWCTLWVMGIQQPDTGQVKAQRFSPVLVQWEVLGNVTLEHLCKRLCSNFSSQWLVGSYLSSEKTVLTKNCCKAVAMQELLLKINYFKTGFTVKPLNLQSLLMEGMTE